jgi:hypothetical protein
MYSYISEISKNALVHTEYCMDIPSGNSLIDGRREVVNFGLAPKHRHEFEVSVSVESRPSVIPIA